MLNHRFADFYGGSSRKHVPAYRQRKGKSTDWMDVLRFIDSAWTPMEDKFLDLLEAFPLPLAVDPARDRWEVRTDLNAIPFAV